MDDYPKTTARSNVLDNMNVFFTWAFTAEMLFKMLACGVENYIKDNYNLFDCFVVLLSIFDFTINRVLSQE